MTCCRAPASICDEPRPRACNLLIDEHSSVVVPNRGIQISGIQYGYRYLQGTAIRWHIPVRDAYMKCVEGIEGSDGCE